MPRRSVRNVFRSRSISGSVRHGCPWAFQYFFHASLSSFVGGCKVFADVPPCSFMVVLSFLKSHQSQLDLLYALQKGIVNWIALDNFSLQRESEWTSQTLFFI